MINENFFSQRRVCSREDFGYFLMKNVKTDSFGNKKPVAGEFF